MDKPISTVAVTGATGFVGGVIADEFDRSGTRCIRFQRQAASASGREVRHFDLRSPIAGDLFDGVDALVHAAYDFQAVGADALYQHNVLATQALFRAAAAAGVSRVVFISSMSAYEGTTQLYGRGKLECERTLTELGGLSVRLGLVVGPDAGGMAAAVGKLGALPVAPLLGGKSHQFVLQSQDLGSAIAIAVTDATLTGVVGLANPAAVPFRRLVEGLMRAEAGKVPKLIPVPWQLAYGAMRSAEMLGLKLPLRADSLLGLVKPAGEVVRADEWKRLGVSLAGWN